MKERLLRLHVFVAVEDSTLLRGFARLKYQATWHARSYGAGGQRNGARGMEMSEHAAVGHRFQLPAQRDRLRAGAPRMRKCRARGLRAESVDAIEKEIDARRQDQSIVGKLRTAREANASARRIDGNRAVVHDVDAATPQCRRSRR